MLQLKRNYSFDEKRLKRRATFGEFWLQTHAKKGSRPLDKLVGSSRSVENGSGEDDEVEDTIQQQNVTWVDTRASEAYSTYDKYVVDKYGEDTSLHPEFDMELWSQTVGGNKKGRLYGIGNIVDPHNVIPGASSMPITHSSNPQETSDSDEVQRLKEKIAELEQDKIEKHAVMEKIEESARLYAEMNERIQLLSQNPPRT
ncbi:hypothetical protein Hanom_Chr06g00533201 [Helianthus anomalus]